MSEIAKRIGRRIRSYRVELGLSQEKLAEMSGCHSTYIGQIERGEKNATLESVEKISSALKVPLSKLFDKIENVESGTESENIPLECYDFLLSKSKEEQEQLFKILLELDRYKNLNQIYACQKQKKKVSPDM